jgi:hypothetical protein
MVSSWVASWSSDLVSATSRGMESKIYLKVVTASVNLHDVVSW